MMAILFNFTIVKDENLIRVERSFNGPLELVWAAWTEAAILDQWWAPKPYRAETRSLDFRVGGRWHYCMRGPEGDSQWCLFDYEVIKPLRFFSGIDAFCDENAVPNDTKPRVRWGSDFSATSESTSLVRMEIKFESLGDLETIIQLGFKEGFTAGLENLDQYLADRLRGSSTGT